MGAVSLLVQSGGSRALLQPGKSMCPVRPGGGWAPQTRCEPASSRKPRWASPACALPSWAPQLGHSPATAPGGLPLPSSTFLPASGWAGLSLRLPWPSVPPQSKPQDIPITQTGAWGAGTYSAPAWGGGGGGWGSAWGGLASEEGPHRGRKGCQGAAGRGSQGTGALCQGWPTSRPPAWVQGGDTAGMQGHLHRPPATHPGPTHWPLPFRPPPLGLPGLGLGTSAPPAPSGMGAAEQGVFRRAETP